MHLEKEPIQTLIFMDFEVAGQLLDTEFAGDLQPRNAAGIHPTEYLERLIASDVDMARVPRIAEMSFVFVPRTLFEETAENMHHKLLKHEKEGCETEPIRMDLAMNVFTCQINPDLSEEDWAIYESKRASLRLRRSELLEKNSFAQEWPAVHHLLSISPKPACLVAHNGLAFDFRILMHELARTNIIGQFPVPDGVFFLDSYLTFLDIETAHHRTIQKTLDTIDWNFVTPPAQVIAASILAEEESGRAPALTITIGEQEEPSIMEGAGRDEDDIVLISADCPLAKECPCPPSPASSSVVATDEEQQEVELAGQEEDMDENGAGLVLLRAEVGDEEEILFVEQRLGDGAGRRALLKGRGNGRNGIGSRKRHSHFDGLDPKHPFRFLRLTDWCPAKRRRIPAHIFEKDPQNSGQWRFSRDASDLLLSKCGNFKLPKMYKMLIGTNFRAHRAQADSEALLQVSMAYGRDFLEEADQNRAAFPKK